MDLLSGIIKMNSYLCIVTGIIFGAALCALVLVTFLNSFKVFRYPTFFTKLMLATSGTWLLICLGIMLLLGRYGPTEGLAGAAVEQYCVSFDYAIVGVIFCWAFAVVLGLVSFREWEDVPHVMQPNTMVLHGVSLKTESDSETDTYYILGTDEAAQPQKLSLEIKDYKDIQRRMKDAGQENLRVGIDYLPHSQSIVAVRCDGEFL